MVSQRFIQAVKLSNRRAYKIAQEAGIHPTTLSRLLNGAERVRPNDPRILAVASVLGLNAEDCFAVGEQQVGT